MTDCSQECTEHGSVKTCIDVVKKQVEKISGDNEKQWEHIGKRPKTTTLVGFIGVGCFIISSLVTVGYTVCDDKISDVRAKSEQYEKLQKDQYMQLIEKLDKMNDMVHKISLDVRGIEISISKDDKKNGS